MSEHQRDKRVRQSKADRLTYKKQIYTDKLYKDKKRERAKMPEGN